MTNDRLAKFGFYAVVSVLAAVVSIAISVNVAMSSFFTFGILVLFLSGKLGWPLGLTAVVGGFFTILVLCSLVEWLSMHPADKWFNSAVSHLLNLFSRACWFLFTYAILSGLFSPGEIKNGVWRVLFIMCAWLLLYNIPAAVWDILCLRKSFREKIIARNKEYLDKYSSKSAGPEENKSS